MKSYGIYVTIGALTASMEAAPMQLKDRVCY